MRRTGGALGGGGWGPADRDRRRAGAGLISHLSGWVAAPLEWVGPVPAAAPGVWLGAIEVLLGWGFPGRGFRFYSGLTEVLTEPDPEVSEAAGGEPCGR